MTSFTCEHTHFQKDGKPFIILSGAIHYFRVPRAYWHDRLLKLKECGFNTVETYTCWNLHEPTENHFDFSGNLDISAFIQTAEELGLMVIVRPGPYICAEFDFGGLPSWLLADRHMEIRCNDPAYLKTVTPYYRKLFDQLRPHLPANGGNLIMIQVENEYGSYGDDNGYLRKVADLYRENGMDCLYFTSDGATDTMLSSGTLDNCLCVANFGSDVNGNLDFLKAFRPDQPDMCGEYWCGWFDHWFEDHHVRPVESVLTDVRDFLRRGASFNFYMFHGGSNFGFCNGANHSGKYEPTITSYDYNAPLNEAGDRTDLYYSIRSLIEETFGPLPPMTAHDSEKAGYGSVTLTEYASLFDQLDRLSTPVHAPQPLCMEDIGQNFGYILYRSHLKGPKSDWPLNLDLIHDRAQIFADGALLGTYVRWAPPSEEEKVRLPLKKDEEIRLDILIENMGRVNYGPALMDRKGTTGVRFSLTHHFGWDMYPLPMDHLSDLRFSPLSDSEKTACPAFFRGTLTIDGEPKDTFLRTDRFKKGFVTVNGVNIGRYFTDAGPQKTLYVPAPFLHTGDNEILLFESDSCEKPEVTFTDTPDLG